MDSGVFAVAVSCISVEQTEILRRVRSRTSRCEQHTYQSRVANETYHVEPRRPEDADGPTGYGLDESGRTGSATLTTVEGWAMTRRVEEAQRLHEISMRSYPYRNAYIRVFKNLTAFWFSACFGVS